MRTAPPASARRLRSANHHDRDWVGQPTPGPACGEGATGASCQSRRAIRTGQCKAAPLTLPQFVPFAAEQWEEQSYRVVQLHSAMSRADFLESP
jgi:hypothetical protein